MSKFLCKKDYYNIMNIRKYNLSHSKLFEKDNFYDGEYTGKVDNESYYLLNYKNNKKYWICGRWEFSLTELKEYFFTPQDIRKMKLNNLNEKDKI
jgi:hypothetical protein